MSTTTITKAYVFGRLQNTVGWHKLPESAEDRLECRAQTTLFPINEDMKVAEEIEAALGAGKIEFHTHRNMVQLETTGRNNFQPVLIRVKKPECGMMAGLLFSNEVSRLKTLATGKLICSERQQVQYSLKQNNRFIVSNELLEAGINCSVRGQSASPGDIVELILHDDGPMSLDRISVNCGIKHSA